MTIRFTKARLAIAILAVALAVPATAYATHVFADVPDDKFYAGPVEWAFDNEITTGKTPTSFAPNDNVTRGESVTFLKRYNDNIVAPAVDQLTDDVDAVEADLSTHGTHTTSHFVVVGTGGVVNNSSYPGVTAIEFATGVYHVDFPGLEVYDQDADELLCGLQATSVFGEGTGIAGATLSDDLPLDEFQVVVWSALPDGTLTNGVVSLTLTC